MRQKREASQEANKKIAEKTRRKTELLLKVNEARKLVGKVFLVEVESKYEKVKSM